jgi:uncharacterized membrane protein YoaK (UPF0700 family)
LLSFVAAFVDTCGFIGLFGLFKAHVTGNFVLLGAELVNHRSDLGAKLLSFPVFLIAVGLTVVAVRSLKRRAKAPLPSLLVLEAIFLATAALLPLVLSTPEQPDDVAAIAIGMTLVLAMGLQNALMRLELTTMPPSTVMTGNVTQATVDVVSLYLDAREGNASTESRARLRRMTPTIAAFLLGAAAGASGFALLGFQSLLLPTIICAWLAKRSARRGTG